MENTDHRPASTRKVTMNLPKDLVEHAAVRLGKTSLTEAVRDALREALHRKACHELLALRGAVELGIDLSALRADE